MTILLLIVFALISTAGIVCYTAYSEIMDVRERGTFYRGVYVNGYELTALRRRKRTILSFPTRGQSCPTGLLR